MVFTCIMDLVGSEGLAQQDVANPSNNRELKQGVVTGQGILQLEHSHSYAATVLLWLTLLAWSSVLLCWSCYQVLCLSKGWTLSEGLLDCGKAMQAEVAAYFE